MSTKFRQLPEQMKRILKSIAAIAGMLTLVVASVWNLQAAVGTALGGLLAVANLWAFARIIPDIMQPKSSSIPGPVQAALKVIVVVLAFFLFFKQNVIPALSLVIGYGALPLGIFLGSLGKTSTNDD